MFKGYVSYFYRLSKYERVFCDRTGATEITVVCYSIRHLLLLATATSKLFNNILPRMKKWWRIKYKLPFSFIIQRYWMPIVQFFFHFKSWRDKQFSQREQEYIHHRQNNKRSAGYIGNHTQKRVERAQIQKKRKKSNKFQIWVEKKNKCNRVFIFPGFWTSRVK